MATKGKKISEVAQDNLVTTASGNELIPCAVNGQNGVITPDTIIDHARDTFIAKEDGIDGQKINDGSIPSDAIANGVISGDKIAEGGISGYNIGLYQISHNHLASGFGQLFGVYSGYGSGLWVNGSKIAPNSIPGYAIGNYAIQSYNIDNGAIFPQHMTTGAITGCTVNGSQIVSNSIPTMALREKCVSSSKLADRSVNPNHFGSQFIINGTYLTGNLPEQIVTGGAIADNEIDNTKMINGYYPRITVSGGNISGAIPVDNVREAVESILTEHNLIPAQTE